MTMAIQWERYTHVARLERAHSWLALQSTLEANTIEAYGRGLEDYLVFSARQRVDPDTATREHLAAYVGDLTSRPNPRGAAVRVSDARAGLSPATIKLRLTAVRLYYDYLCEEGVRGENPVGRGRYTPGKGFGGAHERERERGLIPTVYTLPWIPSDEQWQAILAATRDEPIRTRFMFALAYDAALRREELCQLRTEDIDPAYRLLRIRAETTKGRQERVVPYSLATDALYRAYLDARRLLSRARGPLFLSTSRRNRGQPLTIWTWSKVVKGIAERADVPMFSTHTLRHLCLTDLARAGWDIHEIATFAGHRSTQSTLRYIHLSGRDLAAKLERGMAGIHAWRVQMLEEVLA